MTKRELANKETYSFEDLCRIVDVLRAPDGCPWDRVQTHESIRNNFIEEAYEAVEGIDKGDPAILREELGDVLLEVVFHAGIARDAGEFTLEDVLGEICRKMIRRHPHIFGDKTLKADEIQDSWDAIKRREKGAKSTEDTLKNIACSLPALMRAEKVAEKSRSAVLRKDMIPEDDALIRGGDQLYRLCLLLLKDGVSPEEALQKYLTRLIGDPESYT